MSISGTYVCASGARRGRRKTQYITIQYRSDIIIVWTLSQDNLTLIRLFAKELNFLSSNKEDQYCIHMQLVRLNQTVSYNPSLSLIGEGGMIENTMNECFGYFILLPNGIHWSEKSPLFSCLAFVG